MRAGQFTTIPLTLNGEVGCLEYDLYVDMDAYFAAFAKREFINALIATTLAQLCVKHNTPKHIWRFEPSAMLQKEMNLPEFIPFG